MEQNVVQNPKHLQLWCHMEINHHLLRPIYTIVNVRLSLRENFVTKEDALLSHKETEHEKERRTKERVIRDADGGKNAENSATEIIT
jgi:hypothetical protein